MPVTLENSREVVTYHAPDEDALAAIAKIRAAAVSFIETILITTPACADQQAAIRHVREAMMTANAAIVLKGLV